MDIKHHLIFNKTFLTPEGLKIRNQVYGLWRHYWTTIYADQKSHHVPKADDFCRHDFFSVLMTTDENLVCFSAHSLLDFRNEATYGLDFFEMFGPEYAGALQSRGIHRVMTFESLIVRSEFRRNVWRLPLSRLLMRVNSYLLGATSAQAIMCVSRTDNGVAENSTSLGYKAVERNKICRGFPCDLQYLPVGHHLESVQDVVEPLAENLWKSRIVHCGEGFIPDQIAAAAAPKSAS